MLSKKNHIINYFKEVKYISDLIGISKIEKLVKELVKIRKKKGRLFFLGIGGIKLIYDELFEYKEINK